MKDPVKLEVHNLVEDIVYIKDTVYERYMIEAWIEHQVKEMGAQFHKWKIVEI